MKLKKDCLIKAAQPTRIVKQLDRVVQSYKPISDHKHNVNNNSCLKLQLLFKIITLYSWLQKEFEEKKKAEGKKARDDKCKVMDMLFAAFEKHQYYNIKDLVKITNQPVVRKSYQLKICTVIYLSFLLDLSQGNSEGCLCV